jgi:hypothetical protein
MMANLGRINKKPGKAFRACESEKRKSLYLMLFGVKAANFDSNGR